MPKNNKLAGLSARLSLIYVTLTLGCEGVGEAYNFVGAQYAQYLTLLVFLPLGIEYAQKILKVYIGISPT